jgi:hypothetical protein
MMRLMNAQTMPQFAAGTGEKPRAGRRLNAFLLAFLQGDGEAHPVCLRNISQTGALVEAEAGFALGAQVTFRRSFAVLPARIVWARAGRFGLLFERPISAEDVTALSRRIVAS